MIKLDTFDAFILVTVLLLVSWSLVSFWQRFTENLFFRTFGFDPNDVWGTFGAAILASAGFFLVVWLIKIFIFPNVEEQLVSLESGGVSGEAPLGFRESGIVGSRSPRGGLPGL